MKRQLQMAVLMTGGFLVSSSGAGAINANLCTAIGLSDPQARQLYFQKTDDTGVRVWLPFTSFAATGMPVRAKIRFAYVVKEQSQYNLKNELERSGVLVLKSGQYIQPTPPTNADTVRLVRNSAGADYGCRARPASRFGLRQSVSAISYDLYHDKANEDAPDFRTERGKSNLATIKRFHVAYGDDRYPNCISTDSVAVPFSGLPNNRSQFSYQATTVQNGIVRDTVSWNWFSTPAIAQSPSLTQHYRDELDLGETKANAQVAGYLFNAAKKGNVTAQIFWLKTRAKWREAPVELQHSGSIRRKDLSELSDEELLGLISTLSGEVGLAPIQTIVGEVSPSVPDTSEGKLLRLVPST